MTGGRWGRKNNNAPWIRAVCLLSGLNSLSGGHVYSLAGRDGILWCESRFLPANSGVKTKNKKKRSSARNLNLRFVAYFFFVLKRDFTHAWGSTSSILEDTSPEIHSSGTRPVTFFWAQSSLGGTHFLLGGAHFLLGGLGP